MCGLAPGRPRPKRKPIRGFGVVEQASGVRIGITLLLRPQLMRFMCRSRLEAFVAEFVLRNL